MTVHDNRAGEMTLDPNRNLVLLFGMAARCSRPFDYLGYCSGD